MGGWMDQVINKITRPAGLRLWRLPSLEEFSEQLRSQR